MRFRPTSLLLAAVLAVGGATPALAATAAPPDLVRDPTSYVDPLIGTRNGGNVFPGAVTPFGMLSWSPENTRGDATRTAAPGLPVRRHPHPRLQPDPHVGHGLRGRQRRHPVLPLRR